MMSKRIMASCLALTMVFGMSLNSFAAFRNTTGSTTIISGGVASTVAAGSGQSVYTNAAGQVIHERTTRRVSIADFDRLLQVCNEQYEKGLVKRTQNSNGAVEGTAEPVGPDVTDPEVYTGDLNATPKPLNERQYTGRTVDVKHIVYGPVNELTGKPTVEKIETNQLKLQSMHDYVSKGNKIRFVNGTRLSDTEFVIRVDCDIQDTDKSAPQSFRGDYYVSVLPYKEREAGLDAQGKMRTEAVNVPDEFGDLYNNTMFGPAWFFCMLFDEAQPVGKRDIIGYLVAQRITRWPDWNDLRFYYGETPLRKVVDGVVVNKPNPTQIARESATIYAIKHTQHDGNTWADKGTEMKDPHSGEKIIQPNGQKTVVRNTFVDVSFKYPKASYAYPTVSSSTWLATTQAANPNW
jgi:hypothetical protein